MFSDYVVGILYTLLSGLFFGLLGYFGMSLIHADLSIATMLFWRFLICAFVITLILLPQLKKNIFSLKFSLQILMCGAVFYSTCAMFYFLAAQRIGSGFAMVIFFTYPVMVMCIERLCRHQALSKIYLISILIILVGMLGLIRGEKMTFDIYGIILSLISAALYAFYIFFSKKNPTPALPAALMLSLGCILTCFFSALVEHTFTVPNSLHVWFNIVGIAIVCTMLPIVFLQQGLKRISAVQVGILSVLEPVFVVIFGYFLLHEAVNLTQVVSIVVILGGSLASLFE